MSIEPGFDLREKISQLSQVILDKHPRLPNLLQEIHKTLSAQPENVTLLSESEIQVIVSGLMIQTKTEFAAAALKPAANKGLLGKIKTQGIDAF